MGFIERVTERVERPEDYITYKKLLTAYQFAKKANVAFPNVYLELESTHQDIDMGEGIPTLFVMRPSIFLNTRYDYFLRDDRRSRGVMNYTLGKQQSHEEMVREQMNHAMKIGSSILVEEFPLTRDNMIKYPTHYRMHMFYGKVVIVQVTTQSSMFWMDDNRRVLYNPSDETDVSYLIPGDKTYEDLRDAATVLSLLTVQPYIRIDLVASNRGAMFRSFACMPGDIRSPQHNEFYRGRDDELEQEWAEALIRIKDTPDNANRSEPKPTPTTDAPDDNA
jgi:hypothetical protein